MPLVLQVNIVHKKPKTVAQLAPTTIIYLALVVQIVPLTGKTKLVAQVVVASCATYATTKDCVEQAQNSGTTNANHLCH